VFYVTAVIDCSQTVFVLLKKQDVIVK